MKSKNFIAALIVVLALAVNSASAYAMNLGKFIVNPYLGFQTVYDDNVYALDLNKVHDWYFLTSPGILLKLGRWDNTVELEYRTDIYRYVDTGDFNDVEDHFIRAGAGFKLSRLSFKVNDLATRGHESRQQVNAAITGPGLNRYWSNDASAGAAYELTAKTKVELSYDNYFIDYSIASLGFQNRMDNGVTGSFFYSITPKTSLVAEAIYRNVRHDQDTPEANRLNSNEYWAMAGVTWDITAKSTGTIKVGYEWKQFGAGRKNFDSPVYQVYIDHKFTAKTAVRLEGLRQANETDDPRVGYYTVTSGSLTFIYNPLIKWELKPYVSAVNDRYSGELTVDGDTARRSDLLFAAGIDVTYAMNKWVSFTIGYKHTKRSSNLPFYDFTDNIAAVGLKAQL